MRPITATLLAAAKSLRGAPYVAATVQDRQLRWTKTDADADTSARETDTVLTADTYGVEWMIRARADLATNRMQTTRTNAPNTVANWLAGWTNRRTTHANRCALGVHSTGNVRLFHIYTSGGTDYLECVESSDAGFSWIGPHNVAIAGTIATTDWIAADRHVVIYTSSGTLRARYEPTFGSTTWATGHNGPALTNCRGIAIRWTGSAYIVAVAHSGGIWTGTYDPATGFGATWRQLVSDLPMPAESVPRTPHIETFSLLGQPLYVLSYTHGYEPVPGTVLWTPMLTQSLDWEHFGPSVALEVPATAVYRMALVYHHNERTLWAANEDAIVKAYVPLNWYRALPAPDRYTRTERAHGRGTLTIEWTNPDATLIDFDDWSTNTRAYQPLSQIMLSRGYTTSAGNEAIDVTPYYITKLTYRDRHRGDRLIITATDAWGLLDLWRSDVPRTYVGRSIRWIIRDLCALVGLESTDDATAALAEILEDPLDPLYPGFVLHSGQSPADAVADLVRLAGCYATWTNEARPKLHVTGTLPATPADVGDADEILHADYSLAIPTATRITVTSPKFAHTYRTEIEPTRYVPMRMGMSTVYVLQESRIITTTQLERVTTIAQAAADADWREDLVDVLCRPELVPWDRVDLGGTCAAIGTRTTRVVAAIRETWDSPRQRYTTLLTLADDTY
jgi:hypothetical protein